MIDYKNPTDSHHSRPMLIIGNKSFGPEDFESTRLDYNQAPDKSAYWKIIFLIFQPKHTVDKSIDFLLNPFCIKLVTIHLSACNFAIVYLYKEMKFKPTKTYVIGTQKNRLNEMILLSIQNTCLN